MMAFEGCIDVLAPPRPESKAGEGSGLQLGLINITATSLCWGHSTEQDQIPAFSVGTRKIHE